MSVLLSRFCIELSPSLFYWLYVSFKPLLPYRLTSYKLLLTGVHTGPSPSQRTPRPSSLKPPPGVERKQRQTAPFFHFPPPFRLSLVPASIRSSQFLFLLLPFSGSPSLPAFEPFLPQYQHAPYPRSSQSKSHPKLPSSFPDFPLQQTFFCRIQDFICGTTFPPSAASFFPPALFSSLPEGPLSPESVMPMNHPLSCKGPCRP